VALEMDLPLIYRARRSRRIGTARAIEGEFEPGERAIVLDDLITTGGSKLAAIEPLEAERAAGAGCGGVDTTGSRRAGRAGGGRLSAARCAAAGRDAGFNW